MRLSILSKGLLLVLIIIGCDGTTKINRRSKIINNSSGDAIKITTVKPSIAKAGQSITLIGENFDPNIEYSVLFKLASGGDSVVSVKAKDTKTASFIFPKGIKSELKTIDLLKSGSRVTDFRLFAEESGNNLPIISLDASRVCSDETFINRDGEKQQGKKNCATGAIAACSSDGESDCHAKGSFKAADTTLVTASDLKSGVNFGGVSGSLADCTADGVTGCVTTSSFKSVDLSQALAANIKTAVVLGGVTGTFAGSYSNCSSDAEVGCIATASYKAADMSFAIAGNIRSSVTIAGVPGSVTVSPAACSSAGQQSCVASGTYYAGQNCTANTSACYLPSYVVSSQPLRAISYDTINSNADKFRTSTTFGGVTGTLADCSANNTQGCVTTSTYRSADLTNLAAANIKSGVSIAGQSGDYPSATYPLAGADGTTDLSDNLSTREGQLRSASNFEFFKSDGTRVVSTGDNDISAGNIRDTIQIFGITGSYDGGAPNAWDLRAGVSFGSVTGKLKVNCRNGANLSYFDQVQLAKAATVTHGTDTITIANHGWTSNQTVRLFYDTAPGGLNSTTTYYVRNQTTNTLQLSTTSGGAVAPVSSNGATVFLYRWGDSVVQDWDNTDDYFAAATGFPAGWNSSQQLCGGVETVADDANVWKDATTTGDGTTASTCTASPTHCSFKDKITGLEWHNPDGTDRDWPTAYDYCATTLGNYNGKSGWRLPTQKELLAAYSHGIAATIGTTNWADLATLSQYYQSTTTYSYNIENAWTVYLTDGTTTNFPKNLGYRVICTRP